MKTTRIDVLTNDSLAELTLIHQPPCLSLYQPTHRHGHENQQDLIRYGNLIKELVTSLREKYPAAQTRLLIEPFEDLTKDQSFWNHTLDGLAVLGGPSLFRVFRLQRPVPELAVVADSFHTKPLRRFLQSVDRYQILALNLGKVQLFEGNRDTLDEIEPVADVPRTISDALGEELTEPHQTVASYGGVGTGSRPMHHSHGSKKEEAEIDAERFFRAVDRTVFEHYSRPSALPLMLAALPEHHHIFRQVSQNSMLMTEGLMINPDALSVDELRQRAWQVIEPQYQQRLASLVDEFMEASSKGLGSDDPSQVAQAAAAGKVATLLIEADRRIAGRLDNSTGRVEFADLHHPQVDDLLDDLGELVDKMGGRVMVVPAGQMPGQTGLAAVYRY
jgi:hypothetical protein